MSGTWTPGPGPTPGNDSYVGTEDPNTADGLGGDDTLVGLGGDDFLVGDVPFVGNGADSLLGGDGNDTLDGTVGDDTLLGEDGNDIIFGGTGNDSLFGGAGDDAIEGGEGDDTISGGLGDDALDGLSGTNTFYYNEGEGSDTVFGIEGTNSVQVYAPGGYTTGSAGPFTVLTFTATGSQLYVLGASIVDSTEPLPCFAEGTAILTARGEVPVEGLRVGDLVVATRDGRTVLAPITWLGHSHVDVGAHPRPDTVAPIRIRAGALGQGVPARDLRVSPDHGLYIDGRLVPAGLLVDGQGILREQRARQVTYWHVELPAHAIIVAEGALTESYLDTGNRSSFDNAPVVAMVKDFSPRAAVESTGSCAPVLREGPALDAVRARIRARMLAPAPLARIA